MNDAGLRWGEVEILLRPLLSSSALSGLSIADLVPDKDPDGSYARRLVNLNVSPLTARPPTVRQDPSAAP